MALTCRLWIAPGYRSPRPLRGDLSREIIRAAVPLISQLEPTLPDHPNSQRLRRARPWQRYREMPHRLVAYHGHVRFQRKLKMALSFRAIMATLSAATFSRNRLGGLNLIRMPAFGFFADAFFFNHFLAFVFLIILHDERLAIQNPSP
jgi:hypothetical protein